ncbi:KAT8 regulatory NSL complex subunit 1-like [Athene noctua]|uniref:KAT8 regulatory NSL complex subunit 1-like n=1 Tax=Athene noctua TaxID=126797 RepID=UPI003EBC756E
MAAAAGRASAVPSLCPPLAGRVAAARGRQAALWSRARRLRCRLRVLQGRQVERHVRHQLAGLVRYLRRVGPPGGLPPALGPDLRLLAGSATARLRAMQGACDSDATGSSSGSGEESEADGTGQRQLAAASPGRRHAECQWAMERAAIICRWTWLQAQISDLEYRIRQQTDIYKQLRAAKGPVVLGGDHQPGNLMKKQDQLGSVSLVTSRKNKWISPSSSVPRCPAGDAVPSRFLYNMQKQSSHLTQPLRNPACQRPSCTPISGCPAPLRACTTSSRQVNRVFNCSCTGSSSSSSLISMNVGRFGKQNPFHSLVAVSDNTCVAARIRPVCRYKRRKLVRATSVSQFSRKLLKPLTVKCSCEWPNSCILCSCKASVQTIDPDTMSLEERIALLDSGFHPILSLSHGNPLHLYFETLLREDRLHRLLSHELKTLKMCHFGRKEDPTTSVFPKLHSSLLLASRSLFEGRRQLEGSSCCSFPVSSPRAHKYGSLHHPLSLYPETPPAPSASQIPFTGSSTMRRIKKCIQQLKISLNTSDSGKNPLHLHVTFHGIFEYAFVLTLIFCMGFSLHSVLQQSSKRRKVEYSYDIDNIVIPKSMAAATRVEKPQYKEIVVPSWRTVELELEPFNQADSELEDTSDEVYSSHHSKYEDLERARWDSWAAVPSHKRGGRSSNKADGRWARQPQPASPVTGFNCLNDLCLHCLTSSHSFGTCNGLQALSVHGQTRMVLSCSESSLEMLDAVMQNVQPWEPRTFPLSDSAYQVLLQHPTADVCDQAGVQPWVSTNKPGIRPSSRDTVIPTFLGTQFSDAHLQTDSNKSIEEFSLAL